MLIANILQPWRQAGFAPIVLTALCLAACAAPHRVDTRPDSGSGAQAATAAAAAKPAAAAVKAPAAAPANPLRGMPLPNLPTLPGQPPAASPADAAPPADAGTGGPKALNAAQEQLRLAEERTGLSDTQLAQLNEARAKLASGKPDAALEVLRPLNAQLRAETRSYRAHTGDSLRRIAARPEVYDNADLWPLLLDSNKDRIGNPERLETALRLRFPAHPTLQQVQQAIDYARSRSLQQPAAAPASAQ